MDKNYDHRQLGRELEIFTTSSELGAGLPIWLPNGATIRHAIETFIYELEEKNDYHHVYTPSLGKIELYKRSGHWKNYQESMFPIMKTNKEGEEELLLRPMNCPHHILAYKSALRSYKELPYRIAELGAMYRQEPSGSVGGLSRVRAMTLNDAHIFLSTNQIPDEVARFCKFISICYSALGITAKRWRLSLRDTGDKYAGDNLMWEQAESSLTGALNAQGIPLVPEIGEAAFYGPKIDIQVADNQGREVTLSTLQLDFFLSESFDLRYIDSSGVAKRPVMIHHSWVSTMERLVSHILDIHGPNLPPWISPVQVKICPISDNHIAASKSLYEELRKLNIRTKIAGTEETISSRVRTAHIQGIPWVVVIGEREIANGNLSIRFRGNPTNIVIPNQKFIYLVEKTLKNRSLSLGRKIPRNRS